MGETTAVAHGGDHGSRSWGGAVCGTCVRTAVCPVETTAVAHGGNPQDRAASPRPRCLPKTALPSQDRNGAFSVMARDCSPPRVAPLHRFASILVHCSGDPLFPVPDNCREV
ncbi:hypothetical protein BJP36_37555 [Moorena producens JHB]|uniref:Uncharacterized protein n=1 Tax=Moorena producens (strain JHB) TaxID=1454205 RepID=A0A9Q9SUB0_MOOP1|nr:hypothetical protein [Moorena producens]WAN69802.1 hypothetical protein BJP36_37555 [Moorena producens JHB]